MILFCTSFHHNFSIQHKLTCGQVKKNTSQTYGPEWQMTSDTKTKQKQKVWLIFLPCKVVFNKVQLIKLGVPSKGIVYGDVSLQNVEVDVLTSAWQTTA